MKPPGERDPMRRSFSRTSLWAAAVLDWTYTPQDTPNFLLLHPHRRHVDQVDRSSAPQRRRRPCLHRQLALPHALHPAVRDSISHREPGRRLTLSSRSTGEFKSAIVSTTDKVTDAILETVGDCAQSKYFIVRQPGLTLADLQSDASSSIGARADSVEYAQRVEIPNVMRGVAVESLVEKIASRCGAARDESRHLADPWQLYTGGDKEVTLVTLPSLPARQAHKRPEGLKSLCKSRSNAHA